MPEQQLIHIRRTFSKRPDKRIATQKAFSRRDAGDGLSGANKQAVTAFNTAVLINRDICVRKRKSLHGTNVSAGTTGSMAKTATDARMRHVHRRAKRQSAHQPILKKTKRSISSPAISKALPSSIVPRAAFNPPAAKHSIPTTDTHQLSRCTVRSCCSICNGA